MIDEQLGTVQFMILHILYYAVLVLCSTCLMGCYEENRRSERAQTWVWGWRDPPDSPSFGSLLLTLSVHNGNCEHQGNPVVGQWYHCTRTGTCRARSKAKAKYQEPALAHSAVQPLTRGRIIRMGGAGGEKGDKNKSSIHPNRQPRAGRESRC